MKTKALLLIMLTAFTMGATAKDYTVASPDGKLVITIHADQQRLTWEVQHGKTTFGNRTQRSLPEDERQGDETYCRCQQQTV